jgi:sugar/nucleoside kinase (ribokinase family)
MAAFWEPSQDPAWLPSSAPLAIVGNLNLDIRTAPIRASVDLLRDGETSADAVYETIGGGGANVALAAARLGGLVHFVGCVGRDEQGKRLAAHLERFGVITHLAEKDEPTGRSIALTWDNQQRHFISCLPSSAMLEATDVNLEKLISCGCRHLYRADIWFAPRMLEGANEDLLRRARSAGMETSFDLNWDPVWNADDEPRISRRIESVRKALRHLHFVHANECELCRFAGAHNVETAVASVLEAGCGAVILHRGSRGSAAFLRDCEHHHAGANALSASVNQTGTGDVFAAAFMLRPDLPLPQRLAGANSVAARHLEGSADLLPRL